MRIIGLSAVFTALMLAAGCAVGPDFQKPAAPKADRYTTESLPEQTASVDVHGGEAQRLVNEMDIPGQWWTLFHSKPLAGLIERALKKNPDIQSAQAALRVAWENVYAEEGSFWPSISANFSATRQKVPGQLGAPTASGAYIYSLHTAQVTVAYTPDVFGGIRRQVESLKAQADSQRFHSKPLTSPLLPMWLPPRSRKRVCGGRSRRQSESWISKSIRSNC